MYMALVAQRVCREDEIDAVLAIERSCINYLAVITRQSAFMVSTVSTSSLLPAMYDVPCY